jgi:hypothetical protein
VSVAEGWGGRVRSAPVLDLVFVLVLGHPCFC